MHRWILTSLTLVFALAALVIVPAGTARQSAESRTPVVRTTSQAILIDRLGEIGAWAVPSAAR